MIKLFINNKIVIVPENSSILEACKSIGLEIPRFCFHEKLSIAGNCRMCLVELEKSPKPIASCAMPVLNNMRVFTNTPLVEKARESVLEFLLINHPLDCPICDQGGECDLQDQTMTFGSDRNRFFEHKRGVSDKNCGPLVKTIMTRCIHCTRCIRFASDIAGVEDLGTTNRGRGTEVGTFIQKVLQTELSGNVIDLCPVGALTAKPYAFIARPWELNSTMAIDFSDAIGSNVRLDFKETEIVRVLPQINEKLNEDWISDKARYNFDCLKSQRLDTPYLKTDQEVLTSCSWQIAITHLCGLLSEIPASQISIFCSTTLDTSSLLEIKDFANLVGIKNIGFPRNFSIDLDFPETFLSNTLLSDVIQSDFCLLVGTNPRYEAAMLNLKIRKRSRQGLFLCASVGVTHNLTYNTKVLGISPSTLLDISEGRHSLCKLFLEAKNPLVIYSACLAERKDSFGLRNLLNSLSKFSNVRTSEHNGFCFLNQEANQVAGFSIGLKSINYSKLRDQKLCFIIGCFKEEEIRNITSYLKTETKIINIGVNGNSFITKSSVILPTTGFFEQESLLINLEGRSQKSFKAVSGPNLIREITDIFILIKKELKIKEFTRKLSIGIHQDNLISKNLKNLFLLEEKHKSFLLFSSPFYPFLTDFYLSDAFSQFSTTMAKCSNSYRNLFTNFIE